MRNLLLSSILLLAVHSTNAHSPDFFSSHYVYADLTLLQSAGVPIFYSDPSIGIGYTILTPYLEEKLSQKSHLAGRCAGFERLTSSTHDLEFVRSDFRKILEIQTNEKAYTSTARAVKTTETPEIKRALTQLNQDNIKATVEWLSSFATRYNQGPEANVAVMQFTNKIATLIENSRWPISIELIEHKSTPQKSIHLTIRGSKNPQESVIFGGHFDSINGWGGSGKAPGADDNASGSATLFEILKVLLQQNQPERTVEFFWYAGEESGLLGSAEIAQSYASQKKNVISVFQLDMTLFPGDGEKSIANITDFTNPWLQDYMKSLAATYVPEAEFIDTKCGYACSDHASWYRRGFPAVFPTESKLNTGFKYLHTEKDIVSPVMSFGHSLLFAKIGLAMAMDLGSSNQKPIF